MSAHHHSPAAGDRFAIPVRVYYQDTDAGGVVFHAQYLAFMERARSEFLNARGIDLAAWSEAHGMLIVVHELSIRYLRPARLNEMLTVTAEVVHAGRASLGYSQCVERAGELLVEARIDLAVVNRSTMKPSRLPDDLKRVLA